MFIRNLGTILLALGFVMLASAALIRDPVALDANIGAGILTLFGIPTGVLGLVLIAGHNVHLTWRQSREGRVSVPA